MTKDTLKEYVEAVPFKPFTVRLTNGRESQVPTADFASLSPNGRTLGVWTERGGMRFIDVALITEVEFSKV